VKVQEGAMKIAAGILFGLLTLLAQGHWCADAQAPSSESSANSFDESGKTNVDGKTVSYLIRRLPADSFPDLPESVSNTLNGRGCLIPQTYQAHRPENVIHASFDRPGSSDWAVLCSAHGTVELLVFFSRIPGKAMLVASAPELERIQKHGATAEYGFDWGIDPVSPKQVREAQSGLKRPGSRVDHDALAATILDQKTTYYFHTDGQWTKLDVSD
jgi:hypothetical protein